jgi:hypothetical protein
MEHCKWNYILDHQCTNGCTNTKMFTSPDNSDLFNFNLSTVYSMLVPLIVSLHRLVVVSLPLVASPSRPLVTPHSRPLVVLSLRRLLGV